MRVGKLSGAVGTYSAADPEVERVACERLGLEPAPSSTQILQRDRHAEVLNALALLAASLERFALEIRHLARTEVREVEEPFGSGQKGSSAMPHKRNPIVSERICGLARVVRGNAVVGLENVALWHERDISHSSAERIVLPDAFLAVDYMLDRFAWLMEGLVVRTERMRENLDASHRLYFSQRLLLALVEAGRSRDDAYRLVQRHAMRAWDEGLDFPELVRADAEIAGARRPRRGLRPRRVHAPRGRRLRPPACAAARSTSMPEAAVHLASGKVRELYALDDERLLLVASDRISTFDVVLPTEIPDKGRVLTGLSAFWFARTHEIVPNHLLALRDDGRSLECRRLEMLPVEVVVRGYLSGSGWKDYRGDRRRSAGTRSPPGSSSRTACRSRSSPRRRRPHPATTRTSTPRPPPDSSAPSAGPRSSPSPSRSTHSRPRTRRSAGSSSRTPSSSSGLDHGGTLVLGDEALTPDSSRFWPADEYAPGGPQPSFDKQYVRDYCESLGWDKTDPGPEVPADVVAGTRARYVEAFELLTGSRSTTTSPTRRSCCGEGDRARPPQGGHPRPAGRGGAGIAAQARLRRRRRARRPARRSRGRRRELARGEGRRSSGCARSCSRTR